MIYLFNRIFITFKICNDTAMFLTYCQSKKGGYKTVENVYIFEAVKP